MRRLLSIGVMSILGLGTVLVLTGCGDSDSEEMKAVKKFFSTGKSGDIEGFTSSVVKSNREILLAGLKMKCGKKELSECLKDDVSDDEIKSIKVLESTESTAKVSAEIGSIKTGEIKIKNINLRKEEGVWKIKII